MAITVGNSTNAASSTVTKPASVATGDMVAVVLGGTGGGFSIPGFTNQIEVVGVAYVAAILTRVLDGSEGSTWTASSSLGAVNNNIVLALRPGSGNTLVLDGTPQSVSAGNGSTATIPATTGTNGGILIAGYSASGSGPGMTTPTGMTEVADIGTSLNTAMDYQILASTGSTGTRAATSTGIRCVGVMASFKEQVALTTSTRTATPVTIALGATKTRSASSTIAISGTRTRTATPVTIAIQKLNITRTATPVTMALLATKSRSATTTISVNLPGTRTASTTIALSQVRIRSAAATMALGTTSTRSATPVTMALQRTATRSSAATIALVATSTRSGAATIALSQVRTRSAAATIALALTQTRTAPASIAISQIVTRSATSTIALSQVRSRSATSTIALGVTRSRVATPVTMALMVSLTRSAPASMSLSVARTRSASVTISVYPPDMIHNGLPVTGVIGNVSKRSGITGRTASDPSGIRAVVGSRPRVHGVTDDER